MKIKPVALSALVGMAACLPGRADSITRDQSLAIVGKYVGVYSAPPTQVDTSTTTDAPLLGNGDLGVIMAGNIDAMTFLLGKDEFWSLQEGRVKAMARMTLSVPGLAGASYHVEEDLARAEVRGTFAAPGGAIATRSWVQGGDTVHNFFVTVLTNNGPQPQAVSLSLANGEENKNAAQVGSSGDILYLDVRADPVDEVEGYPTCRVRVAARVIGVPSHIDSGTLTFTLNPGQAATLLTSTMSNYDAASNQSAALDAIRARTAADVAALTASHRAWWSDFYARSFVEIPDPRLEAEWYASLYLMASCSHAGETPPGLFGNWIMKNPSWNGDYTLNYNYEAPFWMTVPTNHLELSENYAVPLVAWLPKAEELAVKRGWTGAYYQVHIGPLPNGSRDTGEHNQKFCGAVAAGPILMRYRSRKDLAYARGVYPMLKQIAIFWQNYLVWDGTRYVINDDAQQEDDRDPAVNGILSLGAVRYLLQGCIDMSTDLGVDAPLREIWRDRLAKLNPFPTFERNGKTVFRWTEVGRDWDGGNTIGIQHIYPSSQIGLDSDPVLIQTAKNMIDEMGRWNDGNGTNTFYPAAARVGYDPQAILAHMSDFVKKAAYPNFYLHTSGGGVESFGVVTAGICEMLLQSFQGKIRVFADWPADFPARFGDLRADGGFLVSSAMQGGSIPYIRLVSELGEKAVVVNPWPAQPVSVYRTGRAPETASGPVLTLPTSPNETIFIAPATTSLDSILDEMRAPPADPAPANPAAVPQSLSQ